MCLRSSLLYLLLLSVVVAGPSVRDPYYESSGMHANALPAYSSEPFAHTPAYSGPHAEDSAASESATSLLDDLFAELGARVPAFGGMFLDGDVLKVYLTSPAQMVAAEAAIVVVFGRERIPAGGIQVLPAQYGFLQLREWHNRLGPLFDTQGVVFTDIDERVNRLKVAVADDAIFDIVEQEVLRLGIPREAFTIVRTEPFGFAASLRDKIRPIEGGTQIAFSSWLCTLGFNAVRASDGLQGFVVNSHCTNTQGGVEGTSHYQPTVVSGNLIGTETADPAYTAGKCPPDLTGYVCRYSDSAFSQRDSAVSADMGLVARPDGVNTGSLTIGGTFRILGEGSSVVGEVLGKVGRTTGWTQGQVTQTCAHVLVSGTDIVQLCQDLVSAGVGPGDSGSTVFFVTNSQYDVELRGILWGSSGGTTFVYSPIANIERTDELGQLTTTSNGPPTISTLTPDKASPQQVSTTVTWTCSASDPDVGDQILHRFWMRKGSGSWSIVHDWSPANTYVWVPSEMGDYQFIVWARDGNHADASWQDDWTYWNVNGKSQSAGSYFTIQGGPPPNQPPSISGFSADKASPERVGETITFTASATDPDASDQILFRFWRLKRGGSWSVVQDWSSSNTYTWTPSEVGDYQFIVWARDGNHADASWQDDWTYWTVSGGKSQTAGSYFTIQGFLNSPPSITGFSVDMTSPQRVGDTLTFTCAASDPDDATLYYRFWRLKRGGSWSMVQDWSTSNTYVWTPTEVGDYQFIVWLRDGNHADASWQDDWTYWTIGGGKSQSAGSYFAIQASTNLPPSIVSFSPDKASPQQVGTTITFTCTATDPDAGDQILYRFWMRKGSGSWVVVQDWSSSNSYAWTPSEVGDYQFIVWIRDGNHADASWQDDWTYWTVGGGKSQTAGSYFKIQ